MSNDTAYYRADVQGLNPGDAATRTLDPLNGKEYTYATTRLDVARGIAARHPDFSVYRVTLDAPIEADPDAAQVNFSSGLRGARSWMSSMRKKHLADARVRRRIWINRNISLTALSAREVAAFLLAAADELEDLSGYAGMVSAQMM
jgi:hypothetical protein